MSTGSSISVKSGSIFCASKKTLFFPLRNAVRDTSSSRKIKHASCSDIKSTGRAIIKSLRISLNFNVRIYSKIKCNNVTPSESEF